MPKRLEDGTVLQFHGRPGTGKTFLSLIMIQTLVKQGYTTHYESSLAFIKNLLEKRYDSSASYKAAIEYYTRVQFLVIDEITESVSKDGKPSALESRVLHDLINARYEAENRCTLIISNRDPSQLGERLGASIADRLMQNSISLIFDWKSYRV
jgi:DNA replication protein DnaC